MALLASLVITGIAIGLLLVYAADVAAAMSSDGEHGFLPLDHMQRGMGLGGPALVLPIIAFLISRKEPSRILGAMIIASGIMIIVGGVAVMTSPPPPGGDPGRDPVSSAVMLFAPAAVQLALGGVKAARS